MCPNRLSLRFVWVRQFITRWVDSQDWILPVFRKAKSLVGLDIGSSAVKAVELKPAGKAYKVSAFGSEVVPPDSIEFVGEDAYEKFQEFCKTLGDGS